MSDELLKPGEVFKFSDPKPLNPTADIPGVGVVKQLKPPQLMMRDRAIAILNKVLEHEPEALRELIEYRVPVDGKKLEENGVSVVCLEEDGELKLGVLGVLNGLLGPYAFRIAAVFEDDGRLSGFRPTQADPSESKG